MKKTITFFRLLPVLLIVLMLTSVGIRALGTNLLTDDFTGTVGTALTANGWTLHSGSGSPFSISSSGLTYTNYLGSGIGNAASTGGTSDDVNKSFTSTNSGSLYMAFMYKPTAASTTTDYSVMFGATSGTSVTSFFGKFYVQRDASNNVRFGITKTTAASATYTGYNYSLNTIYLIIIKFSFVSGTTNDAVSLFVNPTIGSTEPSATVTGASDAAADPAQLISVCLRQSSSTAAAVYDGFRIGTTWADVAASASVIAPTTPASSINFSSVDQNGMTASWTNGDGAKRVVIMNTSNSFTMPTDGTDPTANTVYSGSGEQVVYNGSGTSVAVTGLSASTTYYFRVYEYNGSSTTTKYLSSTGTNNPNSQITNAATSPVITVTGTINAFANTVINATSAEQSYTVQGANLTGDITITPPTGFQISTGTGGSFASTNPITLTKDGSGNVALTTIYVRFAPIAVQAYSGNINHTSTGATQVDKAVSGTGVKAEPTNHATSFAATTNSTNQITVTWTDATGTQLPDGYLVIASTTTPATPVDGTAQTDATLVKNITQGTQQAVFTGLSASTTYNFSIWPYTNSGAAIDYKTDGSVPTASATTETPLGTAVATAATDVTSTGFTANWGATAGATGFDVNVYTKTAGTNASDLFISEYIEGSSSNKYIEIYNGTGSTVDLSDYKLQLFTNGASTAGSDITLSGTLTNGSTVVYKNSSAALTLPAGVTATTNAAVNYNGDDAIALYKISTSSYVDIIGKIGEDPGTSWGTTPLITLDKTLVRKSSVTGGVTTNPASGFPTLATEWDSYNIDVVANLGSHTMSGGASSTPISGSPFTVGNVTSKSVIGLTQGTDYYYTVVAKKGAESAVASNEVSVTTLIPTFTGTGDWTETSRWNTASVPASTEDVIVDGDATISSNVEVAGLTINATKSISVDAGKQLTVSGTLTNNGTLNLLSTAAGTATLNATAVSGDGTANVSQYLSSARNWYVSSPVTAAVAPSGYTYYQRDEAGASWVTQPFVAGNTFIRGKGYIALPGAAGSTLTFSGKLNVADTTVALTWSGASSKGFNLIGNPYPCHLTWTKAFTDANVSLIESSIYYRTNSGTVNNSGQWSNPTYNAFSGASVGGATGVIPPMQAVWVRAIAAGNLTLDNKLTRSHESSNPMKAPAVATSQNLRLVVSDGTYSDEMLVYFNANASNAYDAYDSPKMINGVSSVVPDMYTMVGNEELVINGMSTIPAEIPLYIKPNASTSGQFSLRATEVSNFEAGTQVYIKNGKTGEQQLVSDSSVYSFDITADPLLSIIIKAPGAVTGLDNPTSTFNVYANAKGQLTVVVPAVNDGDVARVYNSAGQCILNQSLTNSRTMLNKFFTAGVYVVKVNETIRKVVIE